MTTRKRLVSLVLLGAAVLLMAVQFIGPSDIPSNPSPSPTSATTPAPAKPKTNDLTQRVIDALPDGKTVSWSDFASVAGGDICDPLAFSNPVSVTRKGNHLVVECAANNPVEFGGKEAIVAKKVEADLVPGSTSLHLKNVKGIQIKSNGITLDLKEVQITKLANGNTKIDAKLSAAWFLPLISISVELDADGQPIGQPQFRFDPSLLGFIY